MAQRIQWRLTASPPRSSRKLQRPRLSISETMSANAVTQRYPSTAGFFEHYHIDHRLEGYESLDELAWRHGMDIEQFLKQLRRAATQLSS